MARNPDDWTPAIGWRNVGIHMAIRGTVAAAMMLGAIAAMAAWFRSSEGALPTPMLRGAILFAVGVIIAGVMAGKLVESTGIVSKALMIVIPITLGLGAFVGSVILDQGSLAIYYDPILFMYPVGLAWVVSSLLLLKDF